MTNKQKVCLNFQVLLDNPFTGPFCDVLLQYLNIYDLIKVSAVSKIFQQSVDYYLSIWKGRKFFFDWNNHPGESWLIKLYKLDLIDSKSGLAFISSVYDYPELFKLLDENKIDFNNSLNNAIAKGHLEIVRLAMEKADLDSRFYRELVGSGEMR